MEHTAWAVVQHTEPYHPEGDKTRTTTEYVHWIYADRAEAAKHKAVYILRSKKFNVEVRKVNEKSWDTEYGAKKKEGK